MPTPTSLLPWAFMSTENAIVNMHELLAVVTEKHSGDTLMLFKDGQKVSVPEDFKRELIEALEKSP